MTMATASELHIGDVVMVNGQQPLIGTPHCRQFGDTGTIDYMDPKCPNLPYITVRFSQPHTRDGALTEQFFPEELDHVSL